MRSPWERPEGLVRLGFEELRQGQLNQWAQLAIFFGRIVPVQFLFVPRAGL